jgi:hypothetical protein
MKASAATLRPTAGPAHSQRFLVGDLFVGRPEGVDVTGLLGAPLDELEDLG